MDVSQVSSMPTSMATAVKQIKAVAEAQMALMKSIAESEQQVTQLLQAAGIGLNIDIKA